MSNRNAAVRISTDSSSPVSKSNNSVAMPASWQDACDILIARAVPAASTAMREQHRAAELLRDREISIHGHIAGGDPYWLSCVSLLHLSVSFYATCVSTSFRDCESSLRTSSSVVCS